MDLQAAAFPGTLSVEQQQLATIMKGYWTNFAQRGFPSRGQRPVLAAFGNLGPEDAMAGSAAPQTETDFAGAHNCAFWTALEAG